MPAMSISVQALFYFLALACFVGAAFAAGRYAFASRVNLIALGLAFWVFVPFWSALSRAT